MYLSQNFHDNQALANKYLISTEILQIILNLKWCKGQAKY